MAEWADIFDGADVSGEISHYPPFDQVLATCHAVRASTLAPLDSLSEDDLDTRSANVPKDWDDTFGTYRLCLQYAADHWYMHRGHLADARRAAGLERMWGEEVEFVVAESPLRDGEPVSSASAHWATCALPTMRSSP